MGNSSTNWRNCPFIYSLKLRLKLETGFVSIHFLTAFASVRAFRASHVRFTFCNAELDAAVRSVGAFHRNQCGTFTGIGQYDAAAVNAMVFHQEVNHSVGAVVRQHVVVAFRTASIRVTYCQHFDAWVLLQHGSHLVQFFVLAVADVVAVVSKIRRWEEPVVGLRLREFDGFDFFVHDAVYFRFGGVFRHTLCFAISIHGITWRGERFFIFVVEHFVTIAVKAYTFGIDTSTSRAVVFVVNFVNYTVTVCVGWVIDAAGFQISNGFADHSIWIAPVERLGFRHTIFASFADIESEHQVWVVQYVAVGSHRATHVLVAVEQVTVFTKHRVHSMLKTDIEFRVDAERDAAAHFDVCIGSSVQFASAGYAAILCDVSEICFVVVKTNANKTIQQDSAVGTVGAEVVECANELNTAGKPGVVRSAGDAVGAFFIAHFGIHQVATNRKDVVKRFADMQTTAEAKFGVNVAHHKRCSNVKTDLPFVLRGEGTVRSSGSSFLCRSNEGNQSKKNRKS